MKSNTIALLCLLPLASAFQARTPLARLTTPQCELSPSRLDAVPELLSLSDTASSTTLLLAEESWRQYVPLAVSALVIVDILLGSPAANSILGVVRGEAEKAGEQEEAPRLVKTKGERIDSSEVANSALEKARNAMEWQTYKESTKREEDRMEELRKKMDAQLAEFDNKQ